MIPRNTRLFTPRDFDYSPYFDIIKCPHLDFGKMPSYRELPWDKKGRICNDSGECFIPATQPVVTDESETAEDDGSTSETNEAGVDVSAPDKDTAGETGTSGTEKIG